MKHTIAQDETIAAASSAVWSVNLPVVDELYIRTTRTAAGNDAVETRLGQLELSVAITGPNGNKTTVNGVPLVALGWLADYNGGEAVSGETDDHVVCLPLGHIAFMDGEELEIRLRNGHASLGVIVDILAVSNSAGPTRILHYHQSQDKSKVVGDVLEVWIMDWKESTGIQTLTSLEDNNSLVTVQGGRVSETNPLEMLEAITRCDGESELWTGKLAKVYDAAENNGLPVNVMVDTVVTGFTGELRTLWITEIQEPVPHLARRARREKVEHKKAVEAVPSDRKQTLTAKGLL